MDVDDGRDDPLEVEPMAVEESPAEQHEEAVLVVYTGPSASLVFEGVEFPRGVPVAANPALIESLRAHELAVEGHSLTRAE